MNNPHQAKPRGWLEGDLWLGLLLFALACVAIAFVLTQQDIELLAGQPGVFAAMLVATLFTIVAGFPHPKSRDLSNIGHVSFDRLLQIGSILILGPALAALLNLIASLLYPWQRLRRGERVRKVLMSSVYNAGMMSLCVLASGLLFQQLGGQLPLATLTGQVLPLLAMIICFESIHELLMQLVIRLRQGRYQLHLDAFTLTLHLSTGLAGILLALIYNQRDAHWLGLAIVITLLAILAIRQLALIRLRLEELVTERTAQLALKTDQLRREANHDALTGLKNRRFVTRHLQQLIRSAAPDQPLTIAIADIDHFKSVNDHYSHAVGDAVLKQIAKLLLHEADPAECIARYGGEEFLLVMPHLALTEAVSHCERLRASIDRFDWSSVLPNRRITISIGVAQHALGESADRLLDNADKQLYQAKHRGRNRVKPELATSS